jgi:hypothetical protein
MGSIAPAIGIVSTVRWTRIRPRVSYSVVVMKSLLGDADGGPVRTREPPRWAALGLSRFYARARVLDRAALRGTATTTTTP